VRVTRWIAAAGAFVISLDSMMNIAFPAIAASLGRPPEAMRWVIIPYVFSYSLMSFVGGALADRVGHARVFRAGLGGVAVAFAFGAVAPDFGWLIVARVVQGLTSGLVYGTVPAIMTLTAAPGERGRALGFLNAAIGLAFTLGPVAAGALIEPFGWSAVFVVRVPLALAAFAWASLSLGEVRAATASRAVRATDIMCARVLLPAALAFIANAGMFAIWLLAPFYLVDVLKLGAFTGGLLFMLTPLGTTLAAPLAGRAADRLGARTPMVAGLLLEGVGLAALSGANEGTPVLFAALALFAAGFGLGLFQVPNMSAVMAEFPAGQQGAAGGLAYMSRTLGIVAGVASLSAIFAARRDVAGFEAAFTTAFLVAASAVGFAALLGLVRPRRGPGQRPARF
jgi:MFS family permease